MHNIQSKIKKIINNLSKEEFIFDFLLTYELPKSTIARVRKWDLNTLDINWEILFRKKVLFKNTDSDSYLTIETLKNNSKNNKTKPRFVIVTDYDKF